MNQEELNEWRNDIRLADQTHPNAFANGPFTRSLFKVSQNIYSTSQHISYLTSASEKIKNSLDDFRKVVDANNKNTENLTNKLFWLNVVLTSATVLGAIATFLLLFKK